MNACSTAGAGPRRCRTAAGCWAGEAGGSRRRAVAALRSPHQEVAPRADRRVDPPRSPNTCAIQKAWPTSAPTKLAPACNASYGQRSGPGALPRHRSTRAVRPCPDGGVAGSRKVSAAEAGDVQSAARLAHSASSTHCGSVTRPVAVSKNGMWTCGWDSRVGRGAPRVTSTGSPAWGVGRRHAHTLPAPG